MASTCDGRSIKVRTEVQDSTPAKRGEIAGQEQTICRSLITASTGEVISALAEILPSIVRCDSYFVYLREGADLVLRATTNPAPGSVDRVQVSLVASVTGWGPDRYVPVVVTLHACDDRRVKCFNDPRVGRFESFLSVPMVRGGHLVGVINAQHRAPYPYSAREVSLIATLAFLGSVEVERARLESENALLSSRLETRKTIERAKGILQRDLAIDEENAYRTLQRESRDRRKPMKEIAEAVLLLEQLKSRSSSALEDS